MNRDMLRQFIVIMAFSATLIVNALSNALPLNGQTPADISNRLANLFVPANYVFSIWGVIYTLLIGFVIYQALPSQRTNPLLRQMGYWFVLSCAANITWIFLFHWNQFAWSVLAMLVILVALTMVYIRVGVGTLNLKGAQRWWVQLPFSVYLGWISVATIANIAYTLMDAGQPNFLGIAGATWATAMLIVAMLLTAVLIFTRRDLAYSLVIIWALIGIVVAQAETPQVANTAAVMIVMIAAAWATRWTLDRRSTRPLVAQAAGA
jgi:hypothetical protein